MTSGLDRIRALVLISSILSSTAAASALLDKKPEDTRLARAEELYHDDNFEEALALFLEVRKSRPEDGILAYRIYYCLDNLAAHQKEVAEEEARARELLERKVASDPDAVSVYYLANLLADSDAVRAHAIRNTELDRHFPSPDPALGVSALFRLARMVSSEARPTAEALAALRAILQSEQGAWRDSPYLVDLTDLFETIGRETSSLAEFASVLDDAVTSRPRSVGLLVSRSQILRALGRTDDARRDLDAALRLAPERPKDLLALGSQLIAADRAGEAVPVLQGVVNRAPFLIDGYKELARALWVAGRSEEAANAFRAVLEKDPANSWAMTNLGSCLEETDRLQEAEEWFRKALEASPESQRARRSLASFLEDRRKLADALAVLDAPGMEGEPEERTMNLRVRLLWRLDRNDEAIRAAESTLPTYPESATLKRYLGKALADRGQGGDQARALEIYQELAAVDPREPIYRGDAADLLSKLDRKDEALALLASTLATHPDYVYGWKLRGKILASRTETLPDAARVLEEAVAQLPNEAALWHDLGMVRSKLKVRETAIEAFRKAVELQPSSVEYAEALGVECSLAGRKDESLVALDSALARMPDAARLHFRRGIVLDELGRSVEAVAALETCLRLDPKNASAHHSLAVAQYRLKRWDESLASWDQALALRPGFLLAAKGRADLLSELGRNKEALAAFQDLAKSHLTDPAVALRIGQILTKLKREEEAEAALLKAAAMQGAGGAPWLDLGDLRRDSGRTDDALDAYSRAATDAAKAEDSVRRRVGLLSTADRHLEGARLMESWIASGHDGAWELETLAIFLRDLGELEQARDAAVRATERSPMSMRPHAILGDIEAKAGRHADAAAAYARAISLDPSQRKIALSLARQRKESGDLAGAKQAAEAALGLEDGADVREILAELAEALGRRKEAEKHWRKTRELAPENTDVHRAAAAFELRSGRPGKALPVLQHAERIAPESGAVQRDLGLVLLRLGDEPGAVSALKKALTLDSGDTDAVRALSSLAERREDARSFLDTLHPKPLALDALDASAALARFHPDNPIFAGQPLAYVLDFGQMQVLPDGTTINTYHGMTKVFDGESLESIGEIRIPFNASRDRLEIHVARTHLPDGRTVDAPKESFHRVSPPDTETSNLYSDEQIEVISMPAVQVGAILEHRFTIREERSLFGKEWWKTWAFEGPIPDGLSRFVLKVPRDFECFHKALNIDVSPVIREEGDSRIYSWTAENRIALPDEPHSPYYPDLRGQLQLSSMNSWEEVGSWYHDLSRNRYVADPTVRAEITALLQGVQEPEEKARRLADFVRTKIRYVGIEFGIGGYQPRSAADVRRTGYGDCKDQAVLLVTLLREVGIEAYPALIRSNSRRRLDEWLPSPGVFDHLITYLPGIRGGMFVDTTMSLLDFGDLPGAVQGCESLVVHPDRPLRIPVPIHPPSTSSLRIARDVDLSRPAAATLTDRSEATGLFAQMTRDQYGRLSPDDVAKRAASDVRRDFPAASDISMDVTGAQRDRGLAVVVQTYTVPDPLQTMGEGRFLLSLEDSETPILMLELSPESLRKNPYIVPFLFRVESSQRVRLPEGWSLNTHPSDLDLDAPGRRYTKRVKTAPEGFAIESLFEISEAEIPVAKYAEFASFMRAVAKNRVWHVVLKMPSP